jgi:hypothetical protein
MAILRDYSNHVPDFEGSASDFFSPFESLLFTFAILCHCTITTQVMLKQVGNPTSTTSQLKTRDSKD